MKNRVLIGTVTLEKDLIMLNTSFQYAASFEELKVQKGVYQIYSYESEFVKRKNGEIILDMAFIEYHGTVTRGNVGNNPGDQACYAPYIRDYDLAEYVLTKHNLLEKEWWAKTYRIDDAWEIYVEDFISIFDNERKISIGIRRKPGTELKYL